MSTRVSELTLFEGSGSLETSLKELLDKILEYYGKFIKTKEDLKNLETNLTDYDDMISLVNIIKNIFDELTEKIDEKLSLSLSFQNTSQAGENYSELEKIMQKYENEIRSHIRIEQQLKLYSESIQTKLDESEKNRNEIIEVTNSIINNLKKDNQKLLEYNKNLKDENEKLNGKIKSYEDTNKQYQHKLSTYIHLEEKIKTLEKLLYVNQQGKGYYKDMLGTSINKDSQTNIKKLNLEADQGKTQSKTDILTNLKLSSSTNAPSSSPLKSIRRTSINHNSGTCTPYKKNDYLKVKLEITENNNPQHKDTSADLKGSYQKIIPVQKAKDARCSASVIKTREKDLGSSYNTNNLVIRHINNSSLSSSSLFGGDKLPKRSNSISNQTKSKPYISRSNFDMSSIFNVLHNDDEKLIVTSEKNPKALQIMYIF